MARLPRSPDQGLLHGVNWKNIDLVQQALMDGGNPNQWLIAEAQGHDPTAGPRAVERIGRPLATNPEHLPLLHWAIRKSTPMIVQRLIEAGADVHAADAAQGRYPLHEAALAGKVKMVQSLIAAGVNVHVRDRGGYSAFDHLHPKVRTVLIAAGFSMETPSVGGNRPLHMAARVRDDQRVRWCLKQGVDVNAVNDRQQTALHVAAGLNGSVNLPLLLGAGANLDLCDEQGRTAYDCAMQAGVVTQRTFERHFLDHERRILKAIPSDSSALPTIARRRL